MKFKKHLMLLLAVIATVMLMPITGIKAGDEKFKGPDGLILEPSSYFSDKCYDVIGYEGVAGDIEIPEYYEDAKYGKRPVLRIGKGAFEGNVMITSVKIPASIVKINKNAFRGCTSLRSVEFLGDPHAWAGENLSSSNVYMHIDDAVFENCTSLTDIEFPYGYDAGTSGENMFRGSGLKHIKIVLNGWTTISYRLNGCPDLEVIDIDCASYNNSSKLFQLGLISELPSLKEINLYGMAKCRTHPGIEWHDGDLSGWITKEDCPSLEYINVYYDAEDIGAQGSAFHNIEQESSDPSVINVYGSKVNGYPYEVVGEGTAEISCKEAHYKFRFIVGTGSSKKELKDAKVTLPVDTFIYTGSEIEPYAVLTYGSEMLFEGMDYTVSCTENVEPGTAKVRFTGKGDYTGEISAEYKIIPGIVPVYLKKAVPSGKTYKLTWNSFSGADGYQVYYSAKKDKGYKKLYVGKKTSTESKKAKSGSYIKIRTYKKVNGNTYYSAWSEPVKIS